MAGAFAVGLAGAVLAIASGGGESPLGTAGAVLVVAALAVGFVATPVGLWLSLRAMRERWRALGGGAPPPKRPAAAPRDRDRAV